MNKLFVGFILCSLTSAAWAEDCEWDTDDADAPDFVNRIGDCEEDSETGSILDIFGGQKNERVDDHEAVYELKAAESDDDELTEVPIAALGFRQHTPGKGYIVREPYSLMRGAKFEESVTLATHRLHQQMAQYCGQGWVLDQQWSEPDLEAGNYYLHYAFTCAGIASSERGK